MEKLKILLLEDEESDALLVLATLRSAGLVFEYEHVENQFQFLDKLDTSTPDIILSDYGLRGYNGLAALRDKKQHGMTCPFILVTGSLPDEVAVACLKAGVDDYVLKDRLSRLPDAIKQALDRQRSDKERRKALEDLIRSQKRLESAERMAMVGNWEWNIGTGVISWSDEMYRIVGADRDSYTPTNDSFLNMIIPEDAPDANQISKDMGHGKMPDMNSRFRIKTLDGQIKMLSSISKSNGKSMESGELKIFGTMQDITLQFLTEKALRDLTEELETRVKQRTSELENANSLLKRKNEEMTDSINYAQLIQKALLAKLDECKAMFPKSFVFWKPRDIVSGDFYWQYHNDDYDYIAVVDCTGHGVPGAFMSMIGHQLLNEVVIKKGSTEPGNILQELDESVDKALFGHAGKGVRDGMDLILCRIDRVERKICFSGAFRPLFHSTAKGLMEYRGNRNPIGNYDSSNCTKVYEQICVDFEEGDTIYLTSDGYYSQFGGPKGKKMMKKRFKELLERLQPQPIDLQYEAIDTYLNEWQGDCEQVDDILVIGIQF
ncbi:MAG: SpoIIE family protein phosphatase [Flavobacteriales bacterium]|nr:SpoIIE family protein phosphatase [Flavobacteriales bacterium]